MNKFLFKIAKGNKKFPNEMYKNMMKNSNLISKKAPLYLFKEAFHSPKTPPEYRAMLLSSLYYDKPNYKDLISRHSTIPADVNNITFQIITDEKGQKHFGLFGFRGYKVSLTGAKIKKPHRIGLPPIIKKQIHNWYPKNLRQKLLTTALQGKKMQFQKAALLIQNITRCLFDIAYITKEFVFMNDPRQKYNTSPTQQQKKDWEEAPFTGFFAESASIFKEDLEHMMMEFEKYAPYLERMGFDLSQARERVLTVYDNLSFYKNNNYNNTTMAEEDALYDIHDNTGIFIRSILEIAEKVEDLNENSPEIYKFGRLEVLPDYVPYRRHAWTVGRSLSAIDDGVLINLMTIMLDLKG